MTEVKPGETVRLKSGGPLMTVDKVVAPEGGRNRVSVIWFDDKHKQQYAIFGVDVLDADDGGIHIA